MIMRTALRSAIFCVVAALAALSTSPAQARNVTLCTLNWEPYYGEELPRQGFFTALVRAAFERGGHQMTVEFMPWARALLEARQGDRDGLLGAYYSDERAETYLSSEPIYQDVLGILARKDLGIESFSSLRDLEGYKIGYGRGYTVNEEFDSADYLNKIPEQQHVLNLRKLASGRIDMIAGSFVNLRYIAQQEGIDLSDMVFLDPPLKESTLHIMMSRAADDSEELLADFHRGLEEIRTDGTYERILTQMGYR